MLPLHRTKQPQDLLGGNKWSLHGQAQGLVSVLQGIPHSSSLKSLLKRNSGNTLRLACLHRCGTAMAWLYCFKCQS